MTTYGWGVPVQFVAGIDLSGAQYAPVTRVGSLSLAANTFFGIVQNKPKAGEHGTAVWLGETKARGTGTINAGDKIGPTTAGWMVAVTSGGVAVGEAITGAASGGLINARLYGGPHYLFT